MTQPVGLGWYEPRRWRSLRLPPLPAKRAGRFLRFAHHFMRMQQHPLGRFPADTRVGDGNTVTQVRRALRDGLIAHEVMSKAEKPAGSTLADNAVPHLFLARV